MLTNKLIPDCGELEPDMYDEFGNLTINSWEDWKESELASEGEEDE